MKVLDASALLAYLKSEPGAAAIATALAEGSLMSAVNLAEVLARRPNPGAAAQDPVIARLTAGDDAVLTVVPFDDVQARETANIKAATAGVPLSLADRACLALGRLQGLPVLTTDSVWRTLKLKVKVVVIR